MKKIRALLFDFGGTLDGNGVHWRDRTYRFIQAKYPEIDRAAFDRVDRASVEQFVASGQGAKATLRETANAISTGIFEGLCLPLTVKDDFVDQFCAGAAECLERNRRWLATLRGRYQLGVISNNFGNTQGWCDEYGLSPLLDLVIDSAILGVSKPEPAIFHAALSALNIPPEAAIYVGDTYMDDMVGAKGVGMLTGWLVGVERKECPDDSVVDFQLADIRDLERLALP
jgi:HAD superfamily hydrolase (TIGR01509 family)